MGVLISGIVLSAIYGTRCPRPKDPTSSLKASAQRNPPSMPQAGEFMVRARVSRTLGAERTTQHFL